MRTERGDSQERIPRLLQALRPVPPRDPKTAAQRRAAFLQACQRASLQRETQAMPRHPARAAAMLVGLVLVLLSSTGLVVSAAQTALPGDALYPVKLAAEQVGIALSLDPASRSQRVVERAVRRAQELDILAFGAPDRITPADLARFERHAAAAQEQAHALSPEQAHLAEALLQRLQEATALQQRAIRRIQGGMPPGGPQRIGPEGPNTDQPLDQKPLGSPTPDAGAPQQHRRGPSDGEPARATAMDTPDLPTTSGNQAQEGDGGARMTSTPPALKTAPPEPTGQLIPSGDSGPMREVAPPTLDAEGELPRPGPYKAAAGPVRDLPSGP